jgi:eukaryotic-like serine/threonine-protein kinase
MLPEPVLSALSTVATLLEAHPELGDAVRDRWRTGEPREPKLSDEVTAALTLLTGALPELTESATAQLGALFAEPRGEALFAWCLAGSSRRDVHFAPLYAAAVAQARLHDRGVAAVRERIVEGPLFDALACAPLLGHGPELSLPENAETRARLEILVWEAGASALEVPALGPWLWGSADTFNAMIHRPAHGALRGRVLAARCLEVSVGGMPPATDPELVGRTLQVLQPLLLHPEPLVWVHAARALGRLTGSLQQMEGTLLDWVFGESRLLRQRAMTALASLPAARLTFLYSQIVSLLDAPAEEAWVLAAMAAATPYLFHERKKLWDRLAGRILAGDGGAIAARSLARGLAALFRRGHAPPEVEFPLRALREVARRARPTSLDEARRWIEIIAVTDAIDRAERDPLDLELGLENLMRVAAQYDDEEADARSARFAAALGPTFVEARRIALGSGRLRLRAAAINALEGCARAFALRLWSPLLATRPSSDPIPEPDLEPTWKTIAHAPAEILDFVREHRAEGGAETDHLPLEVLALRLGGYALDACGQDSALGHGRGTTAHATCLWLRKLEGLADGSRELPAELKAALSSLFWRLVDTTRGTALGEVDDVRWLGPFAAWWALVIDRPTVLLQLATALPMMEQPALTLCCERAEALRNAVSSEADDGSWGAEAASALASLHANDTELAHALAGLAHAAERFTAASGNKPTLDTLCLELVVAATRLHGALSDPVKALHPAPDGSEEIVELSPDDADDAVAENATRIAGLVARAVRARELSMLDVWFASLGPIASALLEASVLSAIKRTPPPPPSPKKPAPKVIEGYELVKPLGEGGIGTVWLVRKPGADRLFVLKIPKADVLANSTDTEREGILASFVEEAKALAGLYHPNVANIIDRGISGQMPFLVLEYLIGADLRHYANARPMTLFEMRHVVIESCAGLAALHGAGLVHRDIKPANLWLRLPLAGGEKFDPEKHRDPAIVQPLSTVVIDFGMVRAIRVAADVGGRFVAGTAGYIAPEQVLDPVELDPRADVYSLAATVYAVTSGRAFFDELDNPRDRILAHMQKDPFEDPERLRAYPAAVAKVMRAATARDPKDRPQPLEFGRAFAAAL